MTFGNMPRAASSRRGFLVTATAAMLAALLAVAGCGGGGSDNPNPSGRATITGRLVNSLTGEGVAGATVQFTSSDGKSTAQTTSANGSDPAALLGTFTLSVPAPATAGTVRITPPAGYDTNGTYNNLTVRLAVDGIPVGAVTAGQQINLGNIRLYSRTDGPPAPPVFP